MKLPEPVGWMQASTGQVWIFKANKDDIALFTEAQLREALAQQEAVLQQALEALRREDRSTGCPDNAAVVGALEGALTAP